LTAFNRRKATLGTIPLRLGAMAGGPEGVLVGTAIGSIIFGLPTIWARIANLETGTPDRWD
jgi:hypothetical protein